MAFRISTLLILAPLVACAAERSEYVVPYTLGQALLIGPDKGGTLTSVDPNCDTDECRAVIDRCGDDEVFADVVLDSDGNVLDVLCYRANVSVRDLGTEPLENASAGNNTVLVFDDADDGIDVTGDVTLEGNNAVIYGQGSDVSVIGGDLLIEKNNAVARGVRIQGDVTITKNNTQLAFCQIDGNLNISGNNVTLAECVVHGEIRIDGNNTVLVQNDLAGTPIITGKNTSCNANRTFDDGNADLLVGDDELGPELVCSDD
jgi:hypothetical protein